ncbi:hypothetical protein M408DRAFT_325939 [Serendipita vermifera MAFF 305830]|uniref:HORMA domain-containing protein n=1 Tax=Serendipita vermifera MAFF 305830 TaxID=933852 RepID=A0A0C3B8I9_SERVB|nr:hypothetical protein M408DRAFT_325939 [Serendipita vermifera MAFF 305830]
MTVKRGFSQEGDEILDYLEKGAFDALEKQYLRRLIFALYIDKEDPQNIVEAWNFDFTYHQIPGTNMKLPMVSMSDSNAGGRHSSSIPVVQPGTGIRAPTLGEVKGSIRNMVHNLIAITQTLEDLPKKRFATFKLEYYPHTPDEYEPPLFVAGDPSRSKLTLSTHHITESPFRVNIGKVDAGFSSVSLEVHSVAGSLPTAGSVDNDLHVLGATNQAIEDRHPTVNSTRESSIMLAVDAAKRVVVWDAEIRLDVRQNENDDVIGLLGEKKDTGEIEPVSRAFQAKEAPFILHVDDTAQMPSSDLEETQMSESVPPEPSRSPPLSRSSSMSTLSTTSGVSKSAHRSVEQDVVEDLGRLNLSTNMLDKGDSFSVSQDLMHLETQPALASWTSETPEESNASQKLNDVITESQAIHRGDQAMDDDADVDVDCDCAIAKGAEDYDVCQCDGPCGRWVHLWCHGYHGTRDPRLPDSFRCFECRLRNTQASVVKGEALIKEYVSKYAELALFRRALKIIEVENPPNATEFRKMIGCNPPVAAQLWKRLEGEGFVGPESVEEDGIGMFESRSMVSRKVGKSKIRKTAKTRYVKNPTLSEMIAPYFDPSEEAERRLVGLGRKHRIGHPESVNSEATSRSHATDKASAPLSPSRIHNLSQEVPQEARRTLSQHALAMDIDVPEQPYKSPRVTNSAKKRKAVDLVPEETAEGLKLRRSKRVKVSVPQRNVDLDW